MRNIEIKARIEDWPGAHQTARDLTGGAAPRRLLQTDTYFNIPSGRLKIREIEGDENRAELIFYQRPNQTGPKRSEYSVAALENHRQMKELLAAALGLRLVVRKERLVYFFKNVRIHLDRVESLGTFLEFEAVMPDGAPDAEGQALCQELLDSFHIPPTRLLEKSYSDLLENRM